MQRTPNPSTPTTARGLVERALTLANEQRVPASTLHLLLVALDASSDLARSFRQRGLRLHEFRRMARDPEEPSGMLAMVQSKARHLAMQRQASEALGAHLLVAAMQEPQSAMSRCLASAGQDLAALSAELLPEPVAARAPVARAAPVQVTVARTGTQNAPVPGVSTQSSMLSRVRLSPMDARIVQGRPEAAAAAGESAAPTQPPPAKGARAARTARPPRVSVAPVVAMSLDARKVPLLATLALPSTQDPDLIGRSTELARLHDALGRREGRGAVLAGVPGVGRATMLRMLAASQERAVVLLRHADFVARWRGAQSEQCRALLSEVDRVKDQVILALDPVAAWFVSRDTPDDLLLELRALLQAASVPWVGVATPEELRRLVEVEPWIDRAAVRVDVDELPGPEVLTVVQRRGRALSTHHKVTMTDVVATHAVALTDRYLGGRAQPERTLGVLDLTMARARRLQRPEVDDETLAAVVAELAAMPVSRIAASDHQRLLTLEDHLASRIVGHRGPIARVSHVIRRNAVGFRGNRPMGTFLFLGPTGVGKTETAKAVAEMLFPGAGALARFDMAEYSEPHAVARLIGAPPGYVGHSDGGQLTEAVRRRPYQLVLLDEIEKAHRDVLEALLGLLDEGRLTDGRGRTVDFRHTLVVMTSNLGAELYERGATSRSVGFRMGVSTDADTMIDTRSESVLQAARAAMPPELWNRIDEPLVFGPLSRDEVTEVARRMLGASLARLSAEQQVSVSYTAAVIDHLMASGGYEPSLGARPMRRTIARHVEAPLADAVLRGQVRRGQRVSLDVQGATLEVRAEGPET